MESTTAAPESTEASSRKKHALGIVFLVIVIDLLGFGVLLPLLPVYGDRLQASELVIGWLSSSFSLAQFVFTPIWGRLSDRIGRRPILLAGLFFASAFYTLFGYAAFVESLTLMFVARIGAGAACATIAAAQAVIADCTPPEKRTSGMALVGAAFGIGFTFGPLLGFQALSVTSNSLDNALSPLPGLLAAGLSAIALVLGIFFLPETRNPERAASLQLNERFTTNAWRIAFSSRAISIAILSYFAATIGFTQFEGTMSLFLKRVFELRDREIYLTYFYIGITFALAQGVLVRRLALRFEDARLAFAGASLLVVGVLIGSLCLGLRQFQIMLAAVPFMAVGYALTTTSLQSLVSKRASADNQGSVLGVNQSAAALARILGLTMGPPLLGISVFLPYSVTAVIMLGVALLIANELRSRPANIT